MLTLSIRKWAGMGISGVDSWPNYVPTGVPRKHRRDVHIIQGVTLSVVLETSQVLSSHPDCHSPRPVRAAQSVPITHQVPVYLRAEVGTAVCLGAGNHHDLTDAASGLWRTNPAL